MVMLKLLIFTLTFCELIVHSDATTCPKGQRVTRDGYCKGCSDGSYQPVENNSQQCKACTKCDKDSGSVLKKECTKDSDTKCQCPGEFVASDTDSSTCKCDIGFGLKLGECSKCEEGYFSTSINSPCKKWKKCKSTEKMFAGTTTADAICHNETKTNTYVATPPTSKKILFPSTRLTSHHPLKGAQTQNMLTTTTTSTPGPPVTPKNKVPPVYPSNTGNLIGMVVLIFGIVGLLVLTVVTCKLHITPYMERQPAIQKNETLCRRPVEESGDSSLSSLKLNPGEP